MNIKLTLATIIIGSAGMVEADEDGSSLFSADNTDAFLSPELSSRKLTSAQCYYDTSLVSLWSGEGIPNDSFGSNDGTEEGELTYVDGQVGKGFSFDGSTAYLNVPNHPSLEMTVAYTFMAWIKNDSPAATANGDLNKFNPIAFRGDNTAHDIEIYRTALADRLVVSHNRDNGGGFSRVGFADPADTDWYHLAVTFKDGEGVKAYKNGVPMEVLSSPAGLADPVLDAPLATGKGWRFGYVEKAEFNPKPTYYFQGTMDEIALFNKALTAVQIPCFSLNCNPISAWDGSSVTGLTAEDTIGDNDGTFNGNAMVVSDAFSFPGAGPGAGWIQVPDDDTLDPLSVTVDASVKLDACVNTADAGSQPVIALKTSSYGLRHLSFDAGAGANACKPIFIFRTVGPNGVTDLPSTSTNPLCGDPNTYPFGCDDVQGTLMGSSPLPIGTWVHLRGTYDHTTGFAALYVNGMIESTMTVDPNRLAVQNTRFFMGGTGGDESLGFYVNGQINKVRVYGCDLGPPGPEVTREPNTLTYNLGCKNLGGNKRRIEFTAVDPSHDIVITTDWVNCDTHVPLGADPLYVDDIEQEIVDAYAGVIGTALFDWDLVLKDYRDRESTPLCLKVTATDQFTLSSVDRVITYNQRGCEGPVKVSPDPNGDAYCDDGYCSTTIQVPCASQCINYAFIVQSPQNGLRVELDSVVATGAAQLDDFEIKTQEEGPDEAPLDPGDIPLTTDKGSPLLVTVQYVGEFLEGDASLTFTLKDSSGVQDSENIVYYELFFDKDLCPDPGSLCLLAIPNGGVPIGQAECGKNNRDKKACIFHPNGSADGGKHICVSKNALWGHIPYHEGGFCAAGCYCDDPSTC